MHDKTYLLIEINFTSEIRSKHNSKFCIVIEGLRMKKNEEKRGIVKTLLSRNKITPSSII